MLRSNYLIEPDITDEYVYITFRTRGYLKCLLRVYNVNHDNNRKRNIIFLLNAN
jgi:hypothetical protein